MSKTEQTKQIVKAKQPTNLSASIRKFLISLSLTELKAILEEGGLIASLKAYSSSTQETHCPALLSASERYWKEATVLSLCFAFKANTNEAPVKIELILEYSLETDRLLCCYSDADDPELPALSDVGLPSKGFSEEEWGKPTRNMPQKSDEVLVKKLHYLPRGRVSFLVSSDDPAQKFVFKMLASNAFDRCLHVASQLKKSDLRNRLVFPRLIYHSEAKQLFIYRYIPGLGIDSLQKDQTPEEMEVLFKRVIETLSRIHQTRDLDLPSWEPEIETRIICSLLNHLLKRAPLAFPSASQLFNRIELRFAEKKQSYTHLIHNDFRTKHLLCDAQKSNFDSTTKLSVIDWDNALLGPREKDIALFLYTYSRKPELWRLFLQIYLNKADDPLDLEFVNHLLQYRFLIKRSRDFLRNKITLENYFDHLDRLTKRLDENPLRASLLLRR